VNEKPTIRFYPGSAVGDDGTRLFDEAHLQRAIEKGRTMGLASKEIALGERIVPLGWLAELLELNRVVTGSSLQRFSTRYPTDTQLQARSFLDNLQLPRLSSYVDGFFPPLMVFDDVLDWETLVDGSVYRIYRAGKLVDVPLPGWVLPPNPHASGTLNPPWAGPVVRRRR
jgi:hypothetical protein